jgi:putative oxidoreductase
MSDTGNQGGPGGLIGLYHMVFGLVERIGFHVVALAARVVVFSIFFYAGLAKITAEGKTTGEAFQGTVELFQYYYEVPFIPPVFAAYSATFFELAMSVLILLGVFTRLAAVPLFLMAVMIQFGLGWYLGKAEFWHEQHYFWMIMLGYLIVKGGGALSVDGVVSKIRNNS